MLTNYGLILAIHFLELVNIHVHPYQFVVNDSFIDDNPSCLKVQTR